MTIVWGCAAGATPRRSSAESAATCSAMKRSDRVRLMNPGPLTSTAEQMSPRAAAATTSSATWRGGRPDHLGQGQGAVGLEVGPVGGPQHRVGAGQQRVESSLEAFEEDAGGVGHPSFSHARPAVNRAMEPGHGTGP